MSEDNLAMRITAKMQEYIRIRKRSHEKEFLPALDDYYQGVIDGLSMALEMIHND